MSRKLYNRRFITPIRRRAIVIRFRLKERIADMSFKTGRRITLDEVAAGTGIHRATLSKLGSKHGYNSSTDVLDRLCEFFGCHLEEIAEHVPDPTVEVQRSPDETQ